MAQRSTTWTINNATSSDLNLVSSPLAHGIWSSNPPQVIKSGAKATFVAESDGFATGDEGSVTYSTSGGNYVFYFNNPFIGQDGYNVTNPTGLDNQTVQQSGNDQVLNTRCFPIG
jgi:hypothetical protein